MQNKGCKTIQDSSSSLNLDQLKHHQTEPNQMLAFSFSLLAENKYSTQTVKTLFPSAFVNYVQQISTSSGSYPINNALKVMELFQHSGFLQIITTQFSSQLPFYYLYTDKQQQILSFPDIRNIERFFQNIKRPKPKLSRKKSRISFLQNTSTAQKPIHKEWLSEQNQKK